MGQVVVGVQTERFYQGPKKTHVTGAVFVRFASVEDILMCNTRTTQNRLL